MTIVSAPIIEAQSFPGSGEVSGNFNQTTANSLALQLNYGSLPLTILEQLVDRYIAQKKA